MSEILVNVTRGPLVESIHRGDIAIVNSKGKLLYHVGDPYKVTFMRSAAKPMQALNVIISGAADKFNFTDAELAVMCASHFGEDFHKDTVEGILKKMGMTSNQLLCGATLSLNPQYEKKLIWQHQEANVLNTDCSGKHGGMMSACVMKGYDLKDYNKIEHPLQIELRKQAAELCEIDADKIYIGIDGCTVPVYGLPLYNMALAFAKIANPEDLNEDYKNACNRIFKAMNNAPEMVSGTDGFCTELMKHTNGKLIGKMGAEAVYCIGIKGRDMGIAVKIEDGNVLRALNPTVMHCLEQLDVLTEEEINALNKFRSYTNVNNTKAEVGKVEAKFDLVKDI